jgi:hypothetical protein
LADKAEGQDQAPRRKARGRAAIESRIVGAFRRKKADRQYAGTAWNLTYNASEVGKPVLHAWSELRGLDFLVASRGRQDSS